MVFACGVFVLGICLSAAFFMNKSYKLFFITAVLTVISICIVFFVFEFPRAGYRIAQVSASGKVLEVDKSVAFTCDKYCLHYKNFVDRDTPLIVSSKVMFLSDNSKVREIEITLYLWVVDYKTTLQVLLDGQNVDLSDEVPSAKEVEQGISSLVEYELYKFKEKNFEELILLSNPFDHEHRETMEILINREMCGNLSEKGFQVKKIEWVVN